MIIIFLITYDVMPDDRQTRLMQEAASKINWNATEKCLLDLMITLNVYQFTNKCY